MPISLYFHIPFCHQKCGYCHFYVIPAQERFMELLMRGLTLEWQSMQPLMSGKNVCSVYFGGGTPALWGPHRIATVMNWVQPYLNTDAEVTLEANPEDITTPLIQAYRTAGINRLSIGIQTFDDALLQRLDRRHTSERAADAVQDSAAAGIHNISIDLMYDLPGQSLLSWRRTLDRALCLPITHISLYNLQIEAHTVFAKYREEIEKTQPSEDDSAAMLLDACSAFAAAGFERYEISAFARDGLRSVHNSGYWLGRPFLGLGPSAYSHWEGRRYRNIANLNRYVRALEAGDSPVDFEETLEPAAAQREALAIGLRLREGVRKDQIPTDLDIDALVSTGFLREQDERIQLTESGFNFYDHVARELI